MSENPKRWKINNLPRKGWILKDVIDNEFSDSECEWCGTAIRYIHILEIQDLNLSTSCGCICAEHLTQDYVNHRKHEQRLKNVAASKLTLLKKRKSFYLEFIRNEKGNYFYNYKRRIFILVFQVGNRWKLKIAHLWGKNIYDDYKLACEAAFDYLNQCST